jgi:hypothetical protein
VNNNHNQKSTFLGVVFVSLALLLLLAPIIVYIITFGISITNNHTRWSEMGSAMSGIYSPVIAMLALVVLIRQVKSQELINGHQFDQSYIQEARSDIQYYLEQLNKSLNEIVNEEVDPNISVRDFLHATFLNIYIDELTPEDYLKDLRKFKQTHPKPFDIWSAIYPILEGLNSVNRQPYKNSFSAAKLKIIVMTSFETCVALDNYHWCLTEDRLRIKYQFSNDALGKG